MKLTCIPLPTGRSHYGHNISCYVCEGHESECTKATLKANHHKYLQDCHGVGDRCMKILQITKDRTRHVQNLCADGRLCDEMEKVCETATKDYACTVSCCHDDACNSADTSGNFCLCLVILCIAFGVIEALNFT